MSVTYVTHPASETSGTSPQTSAAYTPGSAGNQLVLFTFTGSNGMSVSTTSGAFSLLTPPGATSDPDGDWFSVYTNNTEAASSQTFTLTDAGQFLGGMLVEYSGVGSISNGAANVRTGVSSGSNILGSSITVPVGSVLLAICISGTSATTAIANSNGTSRWQVNDGVITFQIADYSGAGAAIQPTFTSTENPGDFTVLQLILNPPTDPMLVGQMCL